MSVLDIHITHITVARDREKTWNQFNYFVYKDIIYIGYEQPTHRRKVLFTTN